ncbi:MAG: hypothetical protein ACTH4Y_11660 [Microbacterium gubbeenense]|uniref:hypothetical protein n=1 Tax=Microbacterium gubbeenense TaxID=159896 RepID=UPI003F9448CB
MTAFTRRTYRAARRRAINKLISHLDWLSQLERSRNFARYFGSVEGYDHLIAAVTANANAAERLGRLIVARGRREKGLWRA